MYDDRCDMVAFQYHDHLDMMILMLLMSIASFINIRAYDHMYMCGICSLACELLLKDPLRYPFDNGLYSELRRSEGSLFTRIKSGLLSCASRGVYWGMSVCRAFAGLRATRGRDGASGRQAAYDGVPRWRLSGRR